MGGRFDQGRGSRKTKVLLEQQGQPRTSSVTLILEGIGNGYAGAGRNPVFGVGGLKRGNFRVTARLDSISPAHARLDSISPVNARLRP